MIESTGSATVVTGYHIELYQLLALKGALNLQVQGIRVGRVSATRAGQALGFTGRTAKAMIPQVEARIAEKFGPGSHE